MLKLYGHNSNKDTSQKKKNDKAEGTCPGPGVGAGPPCHWGQAAQPVFSPYDFPKSHAAEPGRLQSMGSRRVGPD